MVKMRYNEPNVLMFGMLKLMPGINQIEDKFYEDIKNHPILAKKIASGVITVIDTSLVKAQKTQKSVSSSKVGTKRRGRRSIDEIINEINDTYDLNLLKKWLDSKNKEVVEACKLRMKIVGPSELVAVNQ